MQIQSVPDGTFVKSLPQKAESKKAIGATEPRGWVPWRMDGGRGRGVVTAERLDLIRMKTGNNRPASGIQILNETQRIFTWKSF